MTPPPATPTPEPEVTLTQIVAALSVTYTPGGVVTWLRAANGTLNGLCPADVIERGDAEAVARAVRLIGDADPADFAVVEREGVQR